MDKKKYIAPQTRVCVMENILYQSFSVLQKNGTTTQNIGGGPVVEKTDPDGNTDGSWFNNTDNWGGD